MRNVYLNQMPRREALSVIMENVSLRRETIQVAVGEAGGCVTSGPVFAQRSMPPCPVSAMDGIALRTQDSYGASDQRPVCLPPKQFAYIDTGDPLPLEFDAVIKIEDVHILQDGSAEILNPATPYQHVRSVGEDVVTGDLLLPIYHKLTPPDLGVLLAGGVMTVPVLNTPRVAVIPTGTELVSPSKSLSAGELPEFNGTVIQNYLRNWGAEATLLPVVGDDLPQLSECLQKVATAYDLIIVNAGSSLGTEDYTAQAIERLGRVLVHGIATKPGKPTILGIIDGKPIIGLPGYPISAYLALEWFARPLIYRHFCQPEPIRPTVLVSLGRRVVSEMGSEEFIQMSVGRVDDRYVAAPLARGAGMTTSLVRAQGLLVVPHQSMGYEQNDEVTLELYASPASVDQTILAVGSHDPLADLIGSLLREEDPFLTLSFAHVGSMAGLTAVAQGQAHLAGVHLLDAASGEYNVPFIRKHLPAQPVVLVNLAYRTQGWIVPTGNPQNIQSVEDLAAEDIRYVNRQRGAGTRLLLDYLLDKAGITPDHIPGYAHEEYTHLNVAAAVASGTATVGLGVWAAAQAYGLGFVPVSEERYDLLLTQSFFQSGLGAKLRGVLGSPRFREMVATLGGYDLRHCNDVLYRQG